MPIKSCSVTRQFGQPAHLLNKLPLARPPTAFKSRNGESVDWSLAFEAFEALKLGLIRHLAHQKNA